MAVSFTWTRRAATHHLETFKVDGLPAQSRPCTVMASKRVRVFVEGRGGTIIDQPDVTPLEDWFWRRDGGILWHPAGYLSCPSGPSLSLQKSEAA
jgi:hypothetical protein